MLFGRDCAATCVDFLSLDCIRFRIVIVCVQFLPLLQDLSNFIRRAGRLCVNMVHQVLFPHFQWTVLYF